MKSHEQSGRGCNYQANRSGLIIEQDLPSDLRLLDDAVEGIVSMVRCAGCWEDADNIDLALREAITNAIVHGNQCDHSKPVHIWIEFHRERGLLIIVKDAGPSFDPDRVPNPLLGPSRMSNHGRGIYLIKKCMDDVQFWFDSGTAICMRRYPHYTEKGPRLVWRRPSQSASIPP